MWLQNPRSAISRQGAAAVGGRGKVYIVGAGPGDPELLTLKARRIIDLADVIYYDALIDAERLLDGVRAECIFVGKRRGRAEHTQEQINRFLAEGAGAGRTVVRLKGGDPLIFGRGGEEILYLAERGIECEVIPGVSSACAAAASLSLPLTHRGVASSVAFCTGAPAEHIALPDADTKVFYMAAHSAREIVRRAIDGGMAAGAHVALVYNASLPDERSWVLTAEELLSGDEPLPTPLLLVIGEVAELAARRQLETAASSHLQYSTLSGEKV